MRRHVYFYTHLSAGRHEAVDVLRGDPESWLPLPAEPQDGGWCVRLDAGGALPATLAGRDALVRLGPVEGDEGTTLLRRVAWRSLTAGSAFPVLEGDLELAGLDAGCQLSMRGSYRPPLSVLGEAGDRLFGHRVAEACVRRFVLDVAERVGAATLPL